MKTSTAVSVKPVTMIADRRPRHDGSMEPDILAGRRMLPLEFRTLDGQWITSVLPSKPWDQAGLQQVAEGVALMFGDAMQEGANAYLGTQFIGSTEV